jgi:hypothetical protein
LLLGQGSGSGERKLLEPGQVYALGFESFGESYSILRRGGVLVAYGLNLPSLTGTTSRPVFPAVTKLLARNLAFWSGKRTIFYYSSRDSRTFVPDLEALFDLLKTARLFCSDQSGLSIGKHPGSPSRVGGRVLNGSVVIKIQK